MITVGIDLGTQRVQVVVLKDGTIASRAQALSGFDPTKAAEQAAGEALKKADLKLSEVASFAATGSAMDMAPYVCKHGKHDGRRCKSRSIFIPQSPHNN